MWLKKTEKLFSVEIIFQNITVVLYFFLLHLCEHNRLISKTLTYLKSLNVVKIKGLFLKKNNV